MLRLPRKFSAATVALLSLSLMLALVVACGGASETDQPAAGSTSSGQSAAPASSSGSSAAPAATAPAASSSSGSSAAPAATEVPAAAPVVAPTATPQTADTVVEERPSGRLTVGQKELGPFMGAPGPGGQPTDIRAANRSHRRVDTYRFVGPGTGAHAGQGLVRIRRRHDVDVQSQ